MKISTLFNRLFFIMVFLLGFPYIAFSKNCDRYESVKMGDEAKFHSCRIQLSGKEVTVEVPRSDKSNPFATVNSCSMAKMLMFPQVVCPNGDIVKTNLNDRRAKRELCTFHQKRCYVTCPDGDELHKPTQISKGKACEIKRPVLPNNQRSPIKQINKPQRITY